MGLWKEIKKVGSWIDDNILQPVKNTVVATVKGLKSNPLNAVLTIGALATGNAWALPYINAGTALAAGAKPEDVLKAAAASWVASYVTSGLVKSDIAKTLIGDNKLVQNIATGGIRGGLTAALQGKDFGEGVVSGIINQGVSYGLQQVSGFTGAQLKAKFPDFITSAQELGTSFLSNVGSSSGPRELNIYREDDGSKYIYDKDGNILGGVDTEGNSIIGNKGTYAVVTPDGSGLIIKNMAGEIIGGDSVGGPGGAKGDLSDFGEKAKMDLVEEQKFKMQYPDAKSWEERQAIQAKTSELQNQLNSMDRNDPRYQEIIKQQNDLWSQATGTGKYASDYQAPTAPAYAKNELIPSAAYSNRKFFDEGDPRGIRMVEPGYPDQYVPRGVAEGIYGLTKPPAIEAPSVTPPAPLPPDDSQYIDQDLQEGSNVTQPGAEPLPAPLPPAPPGLVEKIIGGPAPAPVTGGDAEAQEGGFYGQQPAPPAPEAPVSGDADAQEGGFYGQQPAPPPAPVDDSQYEEQDRQEGGNVTQPGVEPPPAAAPPDSQYEEQDRQEGQNQTQEPPIPQESQFPSADQWLAALQKYLTNTAISAATRGIVNGLIGTAQQRVQGGQAGPRPVIPGAPSIPGQPPVSNTSSGNWLSGLTGLGGLAGGAAAAPVTYGQQRVTYDEAPVAQAWNPEDAILQRDPTKTLLG